MQHNVQVRGNAPGSSGCATSQKCNKEESVLHSASVPCIKENRDQVTVLLDNPRTLKSSDYRAPEGQSKQTRTGKNPIPFPESRILEQAKRIKFGKTTSSDGSRCMRMFADCCNCFRNEEERKENEENSAIQRTEFCKGMESAEEGFLNANTKSAQISNPF